MDKVKALAAKAWAKYRGWPVWGQIVGGVVLVSVIVGPFLPDKEKDAQGKTSETSSVVTEPTGTTVVETTEAATTTSASPSTTVRVTTTTERATTTTAPPSAPYCEDERNDGAGGFDLLNASFQSMGGSRIARANYVGPSAGRYVAVYFALAHDKDGDDYAYQIGAKKLADGSVIAFVYDSVTNKNTYLTDSVVEDGFVMLKIPDNLVSEIRGNNVDFRVVLSVDVHDIDSCPDDGYVSP